MDIYCHFFFSYYYYFTEEGECVHLCKSGVEWIYIVIFSFIIIIIILLSLYKPLLPIC